MIDSPSVRPSFPPSSSPAAGRKPCICVPVCVQRAAELAPAIARAAAVADLIELRLDYLEAAQLAAAVRDELRAILSARPRPLIFTLRPAEQGGGRAVGWAERREFWAALNRTEDRRAFPDFADLELDLLEDSPPTTFARIFQNCRVICSHHDFQGIPADLEQIYERMARTPAPILKLAVAAREITDCVRVFRLLERARGEGREMIALAMGEAGLPTRILGPAHGAFLTYGALDAAGATAPGQPTATELRELYRVPALDERTEIFGVVGDPVAHSLSPAMHNAAFAAQGLNAVYLPFVVREAGAFVRHLARPRTRELEWRLRGFSVTAPHKSAVMEHLDWIEPAALAIGAVNTVALVGDELRGYNTDAAAALAPLPENLIRPGARVAIIGAGGAARALLWSLRQRGARATVFARDAKRARPTADAFAAELALLSGARFGGFEAVVNTTPLGMRGAQEHETPATAEQLRGARAAYDLVYNPSATRFLREARRAGCATYGGLEMLVAQAAAQFELWTGREAPREAMRQAVEERQK